MARRPQEGHFPFLVVRRRGPPTMACIINMAQSVDHFWELLHRHFTARAIKRISFRTQEQAKSAAWFVYRKSIISGTLAKTVLLQSIKDEVNLKLNNRLLRTFPGRFKTDAMQYGIDHEQEGLRVFLNAYKKEHVNARITSRGLTLHKDFPFIGGSPDGVLSCDCHGESILEVKSPYRLADTGIAGWRILEYLDQEQKLRKTHSHYHQIHLYLGIFELKKAFFIVYAKEQVISQVIDFDQEFFKYQINHLRQYYTKHYLPTIIGKNT